MVSVVAILPGYFSATFKHVISPPILTFPMPPLAPLPPLTREIQSPTNSVISHSTLDTFHDPSSNVKTIPSDMSSGEHPCPVPPKQPPLIRPLTEGTTCCPHLIVPEGESGSAIPSKPAPGPRAGLPVLAEAGETVEIGGEEAHALMVLDDNSKIDNHTMFSHLSRAAGLVWGLKEAMWDELKILVELHRGDGGLAKYGWESDEYTESESRRKFDILWDQYRAYAHCSRTI